MLYPIPTELSGYQYLETTSPELDRQEPKETSSIYHVVCGVSGVYVCVSVGVWGGGVKVSKGAIEIIIGAPTDLRLEEVWRYVHNRAVV